MSLTFVALGTRVDLAGLLVFFSKVVSFAPAEPAGLMLEELEVGLLRVENNRLKLGLLTVAVLELSLESVW